MGLDFEPGDFDDIGALDDVLSSDILDPFHYPDQMAIRRLSDRAAALRQRAWRTRMASPSARAEEAAARRQQQLHRLREQRSEREQRQLYADLRLAFDQRHDVEMDALDHFLE